MTQPPASAMPASPDAVLAFWFMAGPQAWFTKDAAFDEAIRARFLPTHEAAAAGRLAGWQAQPEPALALTILLDQFPRNLFRNDPRAFATDAAARAVADEAITAGFDQQVTALARPFFYLPFMHSEKLADQERCVALYHSIDHPEGLKFAELHADIIRRFGRFPHRNAALGRITTADEQAFLDSGGFSG